MCMRRNLIVLTLSTSDSPMWSDKCWPLFLLQVHYNLFCHISEMLCPCYSTMAKQHVQDLAEHITLRDASAHNQWLGGVISCLLVRTSRVQLQSVGFKANCEVRSDDYCMLNWNQWTSFAYRCPCCPGGWGVGEGQRRQHHLWLYLACTQSVMGPVWGVFMNIQYARTILSKHFMWIDVSATDP